MNRRKSRGLLPEEEQLWRRVADTARPLHPARPKPADSTSAAMISPPLPDRPEPGHTPAFRVGEKAPAVQPKQATSAPSLVLMDKKAFGRMSRGKLVPERRIDLHGMTQAQAHPALIRFVMESYSDGLRLILVITGKGKSGGDFGGFPQRSGMLKQQVPNWLSLAPIGGMILQLAEAHLRHGGSGAFYVYLRRTR